MTETTVTGEPARKPYLVLCQPSLKARVEAVVSDAGLADQYEVVSSAFVPDGQVVVVNEDAVGRRREPGVG